MYLGYQVGTSLGESYVAQEDEKKTAHGMAQGDGWIGHPIIQQDPEIVVDLAVPNIVPEGDYSIAPEGDNDGSDDGAIAPTCTRRRRRRRLQSGDLGEPQWGRDENGRLRRANLANLLATKQIS